MSLSLSFHTNFVQISAGTSIRWAPRHDWKGPAKAMLESLPPDAPILLSLTDLELEVSRSLSPPLTLVFPDGLQDWLELQSNSFPESWKTWLQSILRSSDKLNFTSWHRELDAKREPAATLWFYDPNSSHQRKFFDKLSSGGLPNVSIVPLRPETDEISEWSQEIALIFLKEKLLSEVKSFLAANSGHPVSTWTAEGLKEGVQSPLLGLCSALSFYLKTKIESVENHLYLGWENFLFSYRDSLGIWHSQALNLQPFHSFKVDPHHKLLPEIHGKLFLPMAFSLNPRPTILDIIHQNHPLVAPEISGPSVSNHRLSEGYRTFFDLEWSSNSLEQVLESIREELYWQWESHRTSDRCLIEGPLASFLFSPTTPTKDLTLGSSELYESQFGQGV